MIRNRKFSESYIKKKRIMDNLLSKTKQIKKGKTKSNLRAQIRLRNSIPEIKKNIP